MNSTKKVTKKSQKCSKPKQKRVSKKEVSFNIANLVFGVVFGFYAIKFLRRKQFMFGVFNIALCALALTTSFTASGDVLEYTEFAGLFGIIFGACTTVVHAITSLLFPKTSKKYHSKIFKY